MDYLLDGLGRERVFLDSLQDGFVHVGDVDAQRILTRAVQPPTRTDILRHPAALPRAGLDNQPAPTQGAGGESGQEVLGRALGWPATDASAVESHRASFGVLSA
ncbi:MAG: hypothetical protein A3J29_03535 [Acidobacteria bacterium RIFCSPLOWO2_12_FULL_67_14b]|nr:MAG: hypothetical protein A3J29_03535 [Acidobacteria bacterium RIFCSPLOWO2_12_FULL_67_14b]